MISRLWYFVIAAFAGVCVAAAYVAQGTLDHRAGVEARDSLRRDRAELELMLRTDARNRLDSLGPMAAHRDVRTALASASGTPSGLDQAARTRLGNTLASLNQQLAEGAAQLLFAVDANGTIVAQLGGTTPPQGAGIGAFPVAQRALRGYLTDDVLVYNDEIFRAAARPVVQAGRYVGAIVHCSQVGADLASRITSRLGEVSLAFFFRGNIVAVDAEVPSLGRSELQQGLGAALEAGELQERGHSDPVELANDGLGVFALAHGTARHAGAGYVVARAVPSLGSPIALFEAVPDAVMGSVNWLLVILVPVLLAIVGLLFMFFERDRPFNAFRQAAEALGSGRSSYFEEAAIPARFRKIAHDVNEALGREGSGLAAPYSKADLDEILGQAAPSSSSPYFGFADGDEDSPADEPEPVDSPKPLLAPPGAESGSPAMMTPPTVPPAVASDSEYPTPKPPNSENPFDDDDDSGATMVATARDELVPASLTSPLEQHYLSVYDDFIAMKHKCGEPTVGLTYQKLLTTLEKNSAAIKSKHKVAEVRFKVYEKNGKAALKATPVK